MFCMRAYPLFFVNNSEFSANFPVDNPSFRHAYSHLITTVVSALLFVNSVLKYSYDYYIYTPST